jgi:hypothetical protein
MQTGRLLLRYSDGTNEWREPPTVPEPGTVVRRAGQQWVVDSIETENDDVTVAVLRREPRPRPVSVAQPEVV